MDYKKEFQELFDTVKAYFESRGILPSSVSIYDYPPDTKDKLETLFLVMSKVPEYYTKFRQNKPLMLAHYGHSIGSIDFLPALKKALVEGKSDSFIAFIERLFIKDF